MQEAYAAAADRHSGEVGRANAALARELAETRQALAAERARGEQHLRAARACLAAAPDGAQVGELQGQLADARADARGARAEAHALTAQLQVPSLPPTQWVAD